MYSNYQDLLELAGTRQPKWYDENGTPRFAPFTPELCPSIYADTVALFEIACQACEQRFQVEMHSSLFGFRNAAPPTKWHYGDPPRHNCIGDSMNCDELTVLEVWHRDLRSRAWLRIPELEGPVDTGCGDNSA